MTRSAIISSVRTLLKEPEEVFYENTELYAWTTEGMEWMATYLPLMYLDDCIQQGFVNAIADQQDFDLSSLARFIKIADIRCKYTVGGAYAQATLIVADDVWTVENISIMGPDVAAPVYLIKSATKIKIWPKWPGIVASGCEVNFVQAPDALASDSATPPFPDHTHDVLPYFVASRAKLKDEEWDESDRLFNVARQLLKDLGGVFADTPAQEVKK